MICVKVEKYMNFLAKVPIKSSFLPSSDQQYLKNILEIMSINGTNDSSFYENLPYSDYDVTGGTENEFQTCIIGKKYNVDVARELQETIFYKSLIRRIKTGDASKKIMEGIENFINDNNDNVWENCWIRIPKEVLGNKLYEIILTDLNYDKKNPSLGKRSDLNKFFRKTEEKTYVRFPVSYLLKLSLADVSICDSKSPKIIREYGEKIINSFINDNTSPEIISFTPINLNSKNGLGKSLAKETLKRYFFTQLLVMYSNKRFSLLDSDQKVVIYFSSHPPVRLRKLNSLIPDSVYRELFLNPCLSGWDRGEEKYHYMSLCHQVLSRSHLNTISKLKDAGIITRNLITLPNISNISLLNNGTHVSISSKKITALLSNPDSGFDKVDEKYIGDLVIKIMEHFLPLFVGTFSASPYRIDFWEFHPENVLGFLPHELDFTHLRMIWRRWKKKAKNNFFGRSITPFGPTWLDKLLSFILGLKGDVVIDFRLIDYLVCLLSTDQSPALNGLIGNEKKLKRDLEHLGIFDQKMSIYLLYRLRDYGSKGYSGFEGRYYSVFESVLKDMGEAVSIQVLLTCLAYKYILTGEVTHDHIPDDPTIESERRQIFFGESIGIPTYYINRETKNKFMLKILQKVSNSRFSHRYSGYIRISSKEYKRALLKIIQEDGKELINMMGIENTIESLKERLEKQEEFSCYARMIKGIMKNRMKKDPLLISGEDFNKEAERYYRETLRNKHFEESYEVMKEEFKKLDQLFITKKLLDYIDIKSIINESSAEAFLTVRKKDIFNENISEEDLKKLIHLTILTIKTDMDNFMQKDEVRDA